MKDVAVKALAGVSLDFARGEFVSIMGPSGSGKSTLLAILGCLDRPTSGHYTLNGQDVSLASDDSLSDIRNREIGFIFQSFDLIEQLSVLENTEVPLFYRGISRGQRRRKALEAIDRVGLSDRAAHLPRELSGGQCQRAAIARALVNDPVILLADEPTGNLDSKTGGEIMEVFKQLHRSGRTILLVTHDRDLAEQGDRIVQLMDGAVVDGGN
ncbi:MAG: ABC transporter ATP-binding protein [Planctomycetes bacterium]|nr:ABC transporter ATP-binding protein [Planctomycetota bacterium]